MTQDFDPNHATADRPAGRPAERPAEHLDDHAIASIVRDIAGEWRMPPQRLDQPTWRDRVAGSRNGASARGRGTGWLRRLAGAGAIAVVATVGLSLVAVWLAQPRGRLGPSGNPAGAVAAPRITDRAVPSPLPALTVNGGLPSVTSVLVKVRGYAFADLATGTLGPTFTGGGDLHRLADGRLVCVCVDQDGSAGGFPTHEVISVRSYDEAGSPLSARKLAEYSGAPDPRATTETDRFQNVDAQVAYSPDGTLGLVGWSARDYPVWHAGVLVVDLALGQIVDRLALPDISAGADTSMFWSSSPRAVMAYSGDKILVTRPGTTKVKGAEVYSDGTTHFIAGYRTRSVGRPVSFAPGASCAQGESMSGFTVDGNVFMSCYDTSGLFVRRLSPDGASIGDSPIGGAGAEGAVATVAPDGSVAWFWSPTTRTMIRLDLRTGESRSASAPGPSASGNGFLAGLGRWIAPVVAAKVFVDPGIALAPDGSRIYALGVNLADGGPFGGSSGVYAFDATSLDVLGSWAPTADFVSLAVSSDGRYVYAAGAPGVDASGKQAPFEASVTVYDASDGSVRLLAGNLQHDDLFFSSPVLP